MDAEMKYVRKLFEDWKFMKRMIDLRAAGLVNPTMSKNAYVSAEVRKLANLAYRKNNKHDVFTHETIFNGYSASIAIAPTNSQELALAYGNRSAFLFHLKKYQACMLDIDRALGISVSDALNNKLLDRRARCKIALESSETNRLCQDTINKDKNTDYPKKLNDIFKSVDVRYTEEHGRQLVANRDFTPGQVIFSEKIYAPCLISEYWFRHCSNCMTFSWSSVPCNNCIWAMFCSEQCKKKASEKYHRIECPIITLMLSIGCFKSFENILKTYGIHGNLFPVDLFNLNLLHRIIRCIIIAIKEAGSIEKLKEQIRLVDQSKDTHWQGIKHEGKFLKNKFSILYGISSKRFCNYIIDKNQEGIMLLLLSSMELIPALKKKIHHKDIQNLKYDSDIIFFGSLITKILKAQVVCSYIYQYTSSGNKCRYSKEALVCSKDMCCVLRGPCLAPVSSLLNHSCYANVSSCFTEDQRIITYAVHPIKKNTEILASYCNQFDVDHQVIRQKTLDQFQFICDCPACKHGWLPYSKLPIPSMISMLDKMKRLEREISLKCVLFLDHEAVEEVNLDGAIEALSDCIRKIFREGKKPSVLLMTLINLLKCYLSKKYAYKVPVLQNC